jgi:hypothetical protein
MDVLQLPPEMERNLDVSWYGQRVPQHLREGIRRYILQGVLPGDFLRAVISNDAVGTVMRADEVSFANLKAVVGWFESYAPIACRGSPEAMRTWNERGGLEGRSGHG